jgi:hypothetical protein
MGAKEIIIEAKNKINGERDILPLFAHLVFITVNNNNKIQETDTTVFLPLFKISLGVSYKIAEQQREGNYSIVKEIGNNGLHVTIFA